MITTGKILFVRPGRLSRSYDNLPVVVVKTDIVEPGLEDHRFYEIRYQSPGTLMHGHWYLTAKDVENYLVER